ncbi:CoA-transferase family III [Neolentinus lepideus HHB14362 ss-1]|uniref:CoA-transferase family III n=1 Tax=Neolentinus lepideus HHB14362 ss-1 TaxID=1314782 RepID=A0A165NLC4_9AGAM|nr:CoA-transferase family III [Neolentinus lepideus HHB14362 ss-1]
MSTSNEPPLHGLRVIEFAGLAPGPYAGLVLSDWGASVTRIDRVEQPSSSDLLCRGKRSLAINPKVPSGLDALRKLIAKADVLIDPFRPGVMEKLGVGPEQFLGEGGTNQKLIYARLVGFPRKGPYSAMAGHDINYVALSGVLSMLPGTAEKPSFPLNLLADFAGGGLLCAMGILLALIERATSARGQVLDVDMVSGTRYISLFPLLHSLAPSSPYFHVSRGANILDGGAPFYDVYTCADGRWVSVGCIEPQFFTLFLEKFREGLWGKGTIGDGGEIAWHPTSDMQMDRAEWPRIKEYLTSGFRRYPRDYWAQVFHGTDACVVPVLTPSEAATLCDSNPSSSNPWKPQPQPHPNLSRTRSLYNMDIHAELLQPGQHTREVLREAGFSQEEITKLVRDGAVSQRSPRAKL